MAIDRQTVLKTLQIDPALYPQLLETQFPHVLQKIVELWNTEECAAYFNDLLQPNGRGGGRLDRRGFPERAWDEIFRLNAIYRKTRPWKR